MPPLNDSTKYLIIVFLLIAGVLYAKQTGLFALVEYKSPVVQYYNSPIEVEFIVTNATEISIEAFFNGNKVYSDIDGTNDGVEVIKGTEYHKVIYTASSKGVFRVEVSEGDSKDTFTVEVKQPYLESKNNFPASIKKGEKATLQVTTFDPSNLPIESDSLEVTVELPSSEKKNLDFTKSGNMFTLDYTFKDAGGYIFKIYARKAGYQTVERSAITSVVGQDEPHPVFYIWGIGVGLFVVLIIARIVRKKPLWH